MSSNRFLGTNLFKYWLCLFVFVIVVQKQYAQYYLKGTVKSEEGKEIPFATIKFKTDTTKSVKFFCLTDKNGNYILHTKSINAGWLSVSTPETSEYNVFVYCSPDTARFDPVLFKLVKVLPEVKIVNKPFLEIHGDTVSYTAERFARGNEQSVGELLKKIPGFSVAPGNRLMYNGKLIDKVLINGDDLTGDNYAAIINKLDITGIEKLQVIRDHSDGEDILSQFAGEKNQVLNIKYKKNYTSRNFGTGDFGIGTELKFNGGAQLTSFFKNIKIVTFARANNIGNLNPAYSNVTGNLFSREVDTGWDWARDEKPLTTVQEINTGIEGVVPVKHNNSLNSTILFSVKPVKNLIIKGRSIYSKDNFSQASERIISYQTPAYFILNNFSDILRKMYTADNFITANLLLKKKQQIIVSLQSYYKYDTLLSHTTLLGNEPFWEGQLYKVKKHIAKIQYNKVYSNGTAFSLNLQESHVSVPGYYNTTSALFKPFFQYPDQTTTILQYEKSKTNQIFFSANLLEKKVNHLFSQIFYNDFFTTKHSNNIFFANSGETLRLSEDSLLNNTIYFYRIGLKFQDTWNVNKKNTVGLGFNVGYFSSGQQLFPSQSISRKIYKLFFIPNFQFTTKISRYSKLNFTYSRDNRFPDHRLEGSGVVIQDVNTVIMATNGFNILQSNTLNLFFSYVNLLKRKAIFFANLSWVDFPQFFSGYNYPYPGFAYQQLIASNKRGRTLNTLMSYYKFSNDYKTRMQLSLVVTKAAANTYLNRDSESLIHFSQVTPTLEIDKELKNVQLNAKFSYLYRRQSAIYISKDKIATGSFSLNWKLSKRTFAGFSYSGYRLDLQSQGKSVYSAADLKFQQKSKDEKWEVGISGHNLFNNRFFTTSVITNFATLNTRFSLFPRLILFNLKFRF